MNRIGIQSTNTWKHHQLETKKIKLPWNRPRDAINGCIVFSPFGMNIKRHIPKGT